MKTFNYSAFPLLTLAMLGFPLTTLAQITPSDAQRAQETLNRLEQHQENAIEYFQREQERKVKERPQTIIEAPQPEMEAIEGGACFNIDSVTLIGADHLSIRNQKKLTQPYLGKCLNIAVINKLIREITNYYIEKGYVTTRVVLPQQNIKDGSLDLQVIEGKVEKVTLNNSTWRDRMQAHTAFPGLKGKILNLRDIEQGLDQMNRMESGRATMDLVPGKKNGYTHIKTEDKPEKKTRLSLGVDNSGQDSTGELKGFASLEHDNLFGFGDAWGLNYNTNANVNSNTKNSELFSANASLPYGYWTLSANASYSEYLTTINGANQTFQSSGKTTSTGAKLDRVIHRNQNSKTSANFGLTLKDTKNFIEDAELATGSRNLTIVRFGIDHIHRAFGAVMSLGFGYERGLNAFGAKEDTNLTSADPKAQFDKFTLDASFYRPFTIKESQFAYRALASGQYSNDTLFSSEAMTIGDRYTVRGFQQDSLSGDTGGYLRNELIYTVPSFTENPYVQKTIGVLQPYIGLDIGHVKVNNGTGSGTLTGAAIGIRNTADWVMFDLAYARPITAPGFLNEESDELYFMIGTKFSF